MTIRRENSFRLYGIFGYPLAHTFSPAMQEAAFRALGIKAFYLPFEVRREEFCRLMRRRKDLLLDGFNVTVPYKETVIRYLDGLTSEAQAIGAVNTVYPAPPRRSGVYQRKARWLGANTDLYGFLTSLRRDGRFNPRGKKIFILGAGGSARAAVYGLAQSGAREIRIANRPRFKFRRERIIRDFRKIFPKVSWVSLSLNPRDLQKGLEGASLVINATSVGVLSESRPLIPESLIPKAKGKRKTLFFDFVYHKATWFLKVAQRRRHRTLNGLGMLVYQGAEAFRLWTGKKAPVEVMRAALKGVIASPLRGSQ